MTEDRLQKLEVQHATIITELRGMREMQEDFNDRLLTLSQSNHEAIYGNGRPGLKMQVDRLEQRQKQRNKWHVLVGGAAVSIFLREVWHMFMGT